MDGKDVDEKEEGALSRWSRRKLESTGAMEAEAQTPPAAGLAGPDDVAQGNRAVEAGSEEAVNIEDLPDVDTLTYESDFSVFMKKGVPLELQNLALKKLWRSDPILANVDGLNDYDLDYTKSEVFAIAKEAAQDLVSGKRKSAAEKWQEEKERRMAETEATKQRHSDAGGPQTSERRDGETGQGPDQFSEQHDTTDAGEEDVKA